MTRQPSTRQHRRTFLKNAAAGVSAAGLASLAGCAALEGSIEFSASAAIVAQSALDETDFQKYRTDEPVVERTFEAGGQSKTVEVKNVVTQYDKAIDLSAIGLGRYQAAVFATLSTPQVDVLGKTFNPVGDMSTDDLAAMLQERYEGISIGSVESESQVSVAGQSTTMARYPATATLVEAGVEVDLKVHLTEAVKANGDFVVTFGGYPTMFDHGAEIEALIQATTHE